MRKSHAAWRLVLSGTFGLLAGTGCASNPFRMHKENAALRSSVAGLQAKNADLQRRASGLDANNQELQRQLAEGQQRDQLAQQSPYDRLGVDGGGEDDGGGPRRRPADVGGGRGGDFSDVPGAESYRDGDGVRVRLASAQLFDPGKATLKSGAQRTLDGVADTIHSQYAGYLVGIEGHTDSDPIRKSRWKHNHDLSVQRAMAVYDYLSRQGGVSSSQLFVAGYGPNQPVTANSNSRGKAQNRRVELAIYPDRSRR